MDGSREHVRVVFGVAGAICNCGGGGGATRTGNAEGGKEREG